MQHSSQQTNAPLLSVVSPVYHGEKMSVDLDGAQACKALREVYHGEKMSVDLDRWETEVSLRIMGDGRQNP